MIKRFCICFFGLVAFPWSAQAQANTGPGKTKTRVQGLWAQHAFRGYERMETGCCADVAAGIPYTEYRYVHYVLLIEGDSAWSFTPCEKLSAARLKFSGDSLCVFDQPQPFAVINDSTGITFLKPELWVDGVFAKGDGEPIAQYRSMKTDSVNSYAIAGEKKLVTDDTDGYGTTWTNTFPVKMPSTLSIKSMKQADEILQTKQVYLRINGRKRLFTIEIIEWKVRGGTPVELRNGKTVYSNQWEGLCQPVLKLKPGNWWKGETFLAEYK